MFVDYVKVRIKSGHGGPGCSSFRRERYKPRGGPDGGDGGHGGDVVFVGDPAVNSLVQFRYTPRLFAEDGRPGRGSNCSGRQGKNLVLKVPLGTIVREQDSADCLCEITEPGVPIVVARGGKGGKGNQHFATATRQAPRYAQPGLPGEEFEAELELKVLADIGLVGLPNAGKSSLIAAVSQATPKIADYPFTTLNPVVGVVDLPGFRSLVMADIPGIIEGASNGRGLGIRFLKHVERTRVLLFVVDISEFADPPPQEALRILRAEVASFGHGLDRKPWVIAASKTDLDPGLERFQAFCADISPSPDTPVLPISAATRSGFDRLLAALDKTRGDVLTSETRHPAPGS